MLCFLATPVEFGSEARQSDAATTKKEERHRTQLAAHVLQNFMMSATSAIPSQARCNIGASIGYGYNKCNSRCSKLQFCTVKSAKPNKTFCLQLTVGHCLWHFATSSLSVTQWYTKPSTDSLMHPADTTQTSGLEVSFCWTWCTLWELNSIWEWEWKICWDFGSA